jgi:general secretion pathway protein H
LIRVPRRGSGFTLIEVLMVVLLVGIIAGVVVFYVDPNSPERAVQTETDRLLTTISLATDEAVAENHELGLRIQDNGYAFLAFNEARQLWEPYGVDVSFQAHPMPDGLYVHMVTETRGRLPRSQAARAASKIEPDILLLSSGETTNAIIEIGASDRPGVSARVLLDDIGNLKRETNGG